MIESTIKAGLAAGFLSYLLTQSDAAPKWWKLFQLWWFDHGLWKGKPFSCMLCMSFWCAFMFTVPGYVISTFYYKVISCPTCEVGQQSFEMWYSLAYVVTDTLAAACIAVLVGYLIDKLSITIVK